MEWLVMFLGGMVLFLWHGSRLRALEEKVQALNRELQSRRMSPDLVEGVDLAEPPVVPTAVAPPEPIVTLPTIATAARERAQAAEEEALAPSGLAALMAADLAARSQRSRTRPSAFSRGLAQARGTDEWEALIGGNWLNRIGALALILGIGFFLKYAFDNNWITQSARVGLGVAVGAGLLALARRTHGQGYAIFAQGLVGAGLGILYLSVYASYNFYALVPAPAASVALGLVVAIGFSQALYYDSPTVALLAWGGGFLTPFLLGSGATTPAGVTAYVVLLDAGILAIVVRKPGWAVLEALSLVATYAVYLTWFLGSYNESYLVTAGIALTLFWLVFHALDVWLIGHTRPDFAQLHATTAAANAVAYYGLMFALLFPSHRTALGIIGLAIGAVYAATIFTVRGPLRAGAALDARFTLTALALLVVATALLTSGFFTVTLWSLESVALLWAGSRWNLAYVWQPALALFGAAAMWLVYVPGALLAGSPGSFMPVFNLRFLGFAALAAALAAGTVPARKLRDSAAPHIWSALHFGWCGVVLLLITVESNDTFRHIMEGAGGDTLTFLGYARFLALAAVWTLYSLPLVWLGMRRRILPLVVSGLGSAALGTGWGAAVSVAYQPVREFVPILNLRAGLLVLVMALLVVHLRWVQRLEERYRWAGTVRLAIPLALALLGFELLTAEVNDAFRRAIGGSGGDTLAFLSYSHFLALAGIWVVYSLPLVWLGMRRRILSCVVCGLSSAALGGGTAAIMGVEYQPWRQFVPVLNLRAGLLILVMAVLAVQLRWVRSLVDRYRWVDTVVPVLAIALALLGFELVTAECNDAFRRVLADAGGDRLTFVGYAHFLALAGVWVLYSLPVMWLGLRHKVLPWMVFGLGSAALGSVTAAIAGVAYQPVRLFVPVLNVRAGLLLLVLTVLSVQFRWVRRLVDRYEWADTVRMVLPLALMLLGFELLTAEINDTFARAAGRATQTTNDVGLLVEITALGAAWMMYSLALVWGGVRRASQAVLVTGLSGAGLAVGAAVYCGFVPQPEARLPLVLGLRAGMLPLVLIGLFVHLRLLKDATRRYRWLDGVLAAFQAAIVLLGFELLTGETRDYFDYLASSSSTALADSSHLRNLEQLTLSALWLVYAGVLMAVGLWRRTRWMRLGSIALLGFIILKVFVYDLSFLQGLYRSASFAALGAILLLVSYLYSRYRGLLLQI